MAIRIIPEAQLAAWPLDAVSAIQPLLRADLPRLYQRRADRLRQLAAGHPFGDYLTFAAGVVSAQLRVLHAMPLDADAGLPAAEDGAPPLAAAALRRAPQWRRMLRRLVAELRPEASPTVRQALDSLAALTDDELENRAQSLLDGDLAAVGSDLAVFLWAALSLYWAQMAARVRGQARADGGQRQFCPICGSAPVASVIQGKGTVPGLRYLHCALCESEWHMVRAVCSNCEQSDDLVYWSLDDRQAAVKAESCGHCDSYLKILFQDRDAAVDAVADDLASIILDAKLEAQGFSRSSINPFLFPAG
ncbi:formate dehydrogenase accessory protein FdhE [Sodalis sp. RH21]|uniref:formate dehydrogenase accessory protein FdhE n=1 Tax=unclassified Sodalis (in: enterobacteria) TaxID=2636512 RepID=UPI0039B484BA